MFCQPLLLWWWRQYAPPKIATTYKTINSMEQSFSWESIRHTAKKSGTVIEPAVPLPRSWPQPAQYNTIPPSIKTTLISTPRFPKLSFTSSFPTKIWYAFLLSPIHAPCPSHLLSLIPSQILYLLRRTNYGTLNNAVLSTQLSLPTS